MTVTTRAKRRRVQMEINADLQAELAEVVAVQAQAADTAADENVAYIRYGRWRPDGTRSYDGVYKNGFGFKSDGYPARTNPRPSSTVHK
jgi:hypothetical protein